ncbi:MAG: hypothetical protein IH624_19455 [Phycisphaerae bacterium]|nr:hypothetical protein [Phycisphaerae bacterium]
MNWFDQIMSSDVVYRVGWAIIHSAWQGLAVAVVFGTALILVPRRMSNLRYGCGCLALLAMLAAFCATAWVAGPRPGESAVVNPWRMTPPVSSTTPATGEEARTAPVLTPAKDSTPAAEPAVTPETPRTPPQARPWRQHLARAVSPWTDYICGIWFVGVFAMSIWNLGGWIAVRRLRMIGTWPPPDQLVAAVRELRGRLSISRAVKLLQSTVVKVPMTIGWLKPVILIPASILSELSPQHIEAIIAHELAHVRRCDYLVNLMQTVVETLFFHHPAVWWISHRVRLEREYCCDNAVVKLTADQVNYARALAEIAERKDALPHVAVAADGGSLVGRIRRILGLERESSLLRNRSAGWAIIALVFIAAAFAVGVGMSSDALWAAPYKYGADADDGTYLMFQKMIGTWRVNAKKSTNAGSVRRIEIKPDATCVRHESAENDPNPKTFYDHIRLKDNGLVVSGYWGKQTFALALEGDTMTWIEADTRFVFERVTRTPATKSAAHPIVGKWKSTDEPETIVLEFNADGTGRSTEIGADGNVVHAERGVYRIEGDTIIGKGPDADDQWEPIAWRIEGGALYLTNDDKVYQFTRTDDPEPSESATTSATESVVGTWEAVSFSGEEAKDYASITLTFNADGTYLACIEGHDGTEQTKNGAYVLSDGRVYPKDAGSKTMITVAGDRLTIVDNDATVVYQRKPVSAAGPAGFLGTWRAEKGWNDGVEKDFTTRLELKSDGTFSMTIVSGEWGHQSGAGRYTVTGNNVTFEGKHVSPSAVGIFEGNTLTIIDENTKIVLRKYGPGAIDRRFAGSWKSGEFVGDIRKEITALFLTLNLDMTFVLIGEGADTGEPIRGMWRTDGDILTLSPQTERDRTAMDFVKSARYDGGRIRLAIGAGAAVLERVTANPFAGPEHPMFRAELTSPEWPSGQTWLDLDTGRIIGRDEYATADTSAYELTIIGNCLLLLHSTPGRILPLHDAGMNFGKAGASAVKYLGSLHQSKLTQYDYKEGLMAAVLTDQGNLAVIEMTRTGSDQTPVAWSLASITETADGPPRIEAIGLASLAPKVSLAEPRRATLPDLDETPAFVDLATGEMIVMPVGIEKDNDALRTHLRQLSKGDLGFDKQLIILRNGSASFWNGIQPTAMPPVVHEQFNIRAYDLANIPCRLLVTTGDGRQFDVSVLEKTADGALKIEYRPVGAKVTTPAADSAAVINAADRTRAAELIGQLNLVRMAMDHCELDEGKRPDLSGGWQALLDRTGKGPYIKAAPVNPFTGGSKIAPDDSADWQYDAASGVLRAVVPFTAKEAAQLGLDVRNDVALRPPSSASTERRIERISFARDLSIREALQILAKAFKKNIIPSDQVQGNIPVRDLWNVTLEETLRAILGTHRHVVDGDFIRVYTAGEYETRIARPANPLSHARAWLSALQRADHAAVHLCKSGSAEAGASKQLLGSFSFAEATVEQVLLSDKQAAALIGPAKGPGNRTARFGLSMEPVSGGWQIRDIDYLPEGKEASFISKFRLAHPDATPMLPPMPEGTAVAGIGRMTLPKDAGRRVTYGLDKIALLMRYIDLQNDGEIAALSGYFDQINEFCDDLQGKNGPAPGRDEWGGLDDARIEAVVKLLSDIEQTAEGCRELSRGGHKELLDQHWQLLKEQYGRLCELLRASSESAAVQDKSKAEGMHDHFIGWYRLNKEIVFPVLKRDGTFYAACRGIEVPFKETADGLEWALEPSSMAGTTIGRFAGTNQYYLKNMDQQSIHHLEESGANPLGFGKEQPVTRIDEPVGLLDATAPAPKNPDDFIGWYQPKWFPYYRFQLRKDGDKYFWDEQEMDQASGWKTGGATRELTPLTDGLGFFTGLDAKKEHRLTYNDSLKRFEVVNIKAGPQGLRTPLARIPEPATDTEAPAVRPPIVIGIPVWH